LAERVGFSGLGTILRKTAARSTFSGQPCKLCVPTSCTLKALFARFFPVLALSHSVIVGCLLAKAMALFPRFKVPALNRPPAPDPRVQRSSEEIARDDAAKAARRSARARAA